MVLLFFKKYLFSSRAGAVVKKISWITVVSMTISVSSLVIVMSVMTALNTNIQDRTLAVEPHLWVEVQGVNQGPLLEAHPVTAKLRMDPGSEVQVFENQDVILRTQDGHFRGSVARGLTRDSIEKMLANIRKLDQAKSGSLEAQKIEYLEPGDIMMGVDLAVSLGVFEGDSVMVVPPEGLLLPPSESPKFEKVRVKRILSTNLADVDAQNIFYVRDETLRSLRDAASRKVAIQVSLEDPYSAEKYKKELISFPEAKVETWKERNSALFLALRIEKIVIGLFLSIAALLASFSMISVLTLLISQKTGEIGILQAIGLSSKKVQQLFMQIGLILSGIGLGIGLIIGLAISLFVEKYPLNVLPDIYYDSQIPAEVDFGYILVIFIVGSALSFSGSYLSSKSAALLTPSEALRK